MLSSAPKTLSTILEINSIKELLCHLESGVLFVSDVDDTLSHPDRWLGSDKWFEEQMKRGRDFSELKKKYNAVQTATTEVVPVEQETPEVLQRVLSEHNAIALTARDYTMAETTASQLAGHGIDFNRGVFSGKDFPLYENNPLAGFKNGIGLCDGKNKGDALVKIIETLGLNPTSIVFIDDKEKHVRSVVEEIRAHFDIPVIGLRYGYRDPVNQAYCHHTAAVQEVFFDKHGVLLSDPMARAIHLSNTPKFGIELEEGQALLWSTEEDIHCTLKSLGLKPYRVDAKNVMVQGEYRLCYRFKVPFDILLEKIPNFKKHHLLSDTELDDIASKLKTQQTTSQPTAVLFSFPGSPKPAAPDGSPSLRGLSRSKPGTL